MHIAAYILLGIIALVIIGFFALGKGSQKGCAPGLVDGKLAKLSSKPNCVSSEEGTADTRKVDTFPASNWDGLKKAIMSHSGVITKEKDGYMAAEFTSKSFKFVDDVEARIDGDTIHIRSGSRVGYSDRGVNRARVDSLRAAL